MSSQSRLTEPGGEGTLGEWPTADGRDANRRQVPRLRRRPKAVGPISRPFREWQSGRYSNQYRPSSAQRLRRRVRRVWRAAARSHGSACRRTSFDRSTPEYVLPWQPEETSEAWKATSWGQWERNQQDLWRSLRGGGDSERTTAVPLPSARPAQDSTDVRGA